MSWPLKKILSSVQMIEDVGGWVTVCRNGKFSIKKMYQCLLGDHVKVIWRRIVCNNKASPKSLFITWLALWNRLPTKDRLVAWKITTVEDCPLCTTKKESAAHLFFECDYSAAVWNTILHSLKFTRKASSFDQELAWILKATKRTGDRYKLLVMYFAECLYSIWL
ncbi:uncharacterized protein [Spinacia oleracea]|uniref:Reverse transcriptase zinc-binding domain-containing protein n=1 Tax=Spinacia oleracea TaxID=3562 RepID=A0A9R0JSF5_SPIOL|nr:uncharacterized protein LOC110785169 [Spinacia oleracea]